MHYNRKIRTFLRAGLGMEAQNALCLRVLTKLAQMWYAETKCQCLF